MTFYAAIVASEFSSWVDKARGDRLVDYALSCRAEMFAARRTGNEDPLGLLAAEIAYDRALVRLCDERGIEIDVECIASSRTTRLYLEYQLYRAGVDLHALASPAPSRRH